jgi:hypothetical protein
MKPETSEKMRYLFRLNAEEGTASRAEVPGYASAARRAPPKVVNEGTEDKRYRRSLGRSDGRRYSVLVMLDEPQALPETWIRNVAGMPFQPRKSCAYRANIGINKYAGRPRSRPRPRRRRVKANRPHRPSSLPTWIDIASPRVPVRSGRGSHRQPRGEAGYIFAAMPGTKLDGGVLRSGS